MLKIAICETIGEQGRFRTGFFSGAVLKTPGLWVHCVLQRQGRQDAIACCATLAHEIKGVIHV
jgi:hypothetical protein